MANDFGGSVEASAGGAGIGGGNASGSNGVGSGDGSGGGGGTSTGGLGATGALGLGGFSANDPPQATVADFAVLGQVAGSGLAGAVGKLGGAAISMAIAGTAAYGSRIDTAVGHVAHDINASMGFGGQAMLGGLQ